MNVSKDEQKKNLNILRTSTVVLWLSLKIQKKRNCIFQNSKALNQLETQKKWNNIVSLKNSRFTKVNRNSYRVTVVNNFQFPSAYLIHFGLYLRAQICRCCLNVILYLIKVQLPKFLLKQAHLYLHLIPGTFNLLLSLFTWNTL